MLREDQLKITQQALDFFMEMRGKTGDPLTESEMRTAQSAYTALDQFIDGDSIASVWSVEDVYSLMFPEDDLDRGHTDEEIRIAREVLKRADSEHDATIGINWDTLQYHLDEVQSSCPICNQTQDADGRCACTNPDSN